MKQPLNNNITYQQEAQKGFGRWLHLFTAFLLPIVLTGCHLFEEHEDFKSPTLQVPEGFKAEKIIGGLHLPTSLTWDDEGNMYVVEAGGGLEPDKLSTMRIMHIKDGVSTEVVDLSNKGINPAIVGIVWHDGAFYITHRGDDLTGAVSRVTKSGQVQTILQGIIDSQAEHQINDIRMGPDGRMYVAVGLAGNAGVMDPSVAPWIMRSPNLHANPCQDIVLRGRNFRTPDIRTDDPDDIAMTGAFVPFGTETHPSEVIKGVKLCGGSILSFDPTDPIGTVETHAWGFRNLIGLAWNRTTGDMYAAENGYDVRGARPVKDYLDASLRIKKGMWYGVPDFSAGREPLTMEKFEVPDSLQAMVFVNGQPVGKDLDFVIDHAASGLTPPDPSVVLGRHEFNSSPSMIDVAPASWGDMAGFAFIAEWGDLAPPTNPLRGKAPAGSQVVMVNPATGELKPFLRNQLPGPASAQGKAGKGLDRPFDVQFGPDDALYIVDYGIVKINMNRRPPYAYEPGTGAIWKVTKK
ncbi:PQQ-dependent sugar dehydrogenase [Pontibacter sp. CAU 1760]